ncbi:MAG: ABC transporter substrate-binding protein [Pseudonocardiaceae bacterium]
MNRQRGELRTFSVMLCLLAVLTGCASTQNITSASPVPVTDGRLTVALEFGPKAGLAIDTDDAFVLTELGVVETLVQADPKGQGVPALATSWQRIDPRTWHFQLRPGVSFHDGTPLTPDAVVTALRYVSSVAAPPRAIKGVGLQAVSDGPDAVRISTTNPDPILPLRLSSPNTAILAPSAYRPTGSPTPIRTGTGPFMLTEVQEAQSATVARWDRYWGPRAALATAQARFIPDPMARATALRAGDVDLAQGIPDTALPELASIPQITVVTSPLPRTVTLYTNLTAPPLADPRVRRAIELAIDRPALATQVLNGSATAASGVFGAAVPWGDTAIPPGADPDAAARLLAQAGYGPGKPLTLRLWTYPARAELPTLATAVQAMLKTAGIEAGIRVAEYNTLQSDVLAGRYDLFVLSRSSLTDIPDAAGFLSSDYTCAGSFNLNRYCSPAFDTLVASLSQTADPTQRQQIFQTAAKQLNQDIAGVPLVHSQARVGMRNVTGFVPDPQEHSLLTPQLARTG